MSCRVWMEERELSMRVLARKRTRKKDGDKKCEWMEKWVTHVDS